MLGTLGRGSVAVVYLAKRQSDGKDVALKHVGGLPDSGTVDATRKEFRTLQLFRHPHIIQAFDFFAANNSFCLVLECFEGLTLSKAARKQPFPEPVALKLFRMLAGAVLTLHERRVVHRDVKPDNIMVSQDLTDLRLMDFNTAKRLTEGGSLSMTGTALFLPPEVQEGYETPSELSDIWSMGICLHFMLSGKLPRVKRCSSTAVYHEFVANTQLQLDSGFLDGISDSCKRVLCQCLSIDKKNRTGLAQLLEKEWPQMPEETAFERSRSSGDPGQEPMSPCQLTNWGRGASC